MIELLLDAKGLLTYSSVLSHLTLKNCYKNVLLFLFLGFRGRDWKVSSFPEVSKLVRITAG